MTTRVFKGAKRIDDHSKDSSSEVRAKNTSSSSKRPSSATSLRNKVSQAKNYSITSINLTENALSSDNASISGESVHSTISKNSDQSSVYNVTISPKRDNAASFLRILGYKYDNQKLVSIDDRPISPLKNRLELSMLDPVKLVQEHLDDQVRLKSTIFNKDASDKGTTISSRFEKLRPSSASSCVSTSNWRSQSRDLMTKLKAQNQVRECFSSDYDKLDEIGSNIVYSGVSDESISSMISSFKVADTINSVFVDEPPRATKTAEKPPLGHRQAMIRIQSNDPNNSNELNEKMFGLKPPLMIAKPKIDLEADEEDSLSTSINKSLCEDSEEISKPIISGSYSIRVIEKSLIEKAVDDWALQREPVNNLSFDSVPLDNVPPFDLETQLDENNYFGEAAKLRFFGKFHELSSNLWKKAPHSKLDTNDKESDYYKQLLSLSPRSRFVSRFIEISDQPPVPIIVRADRNDDELNLAHMFLKDDYIIILSEVINDLPRVYRVNIRDNRLTDRSMGVFVDALSQQHRVIELDLSENKVDSVTAQALQSFLRNSTCQLKVLRLSGADVDDFEVATFCHALENNVSLTDLDLSHNYIGSVSEKNISSNNANSSSQETEPIGASAISAALCKNQSIQILDLSWNKMGPYSADALSTALSQSNCLLRLILSYNNIKDDGAEAIGGALCNNRCLKYLDISYNGIGATGCFVLAGALRWNGTLELLDLSGNPIGISGGSALVSVLNFHTCRREFRLRSCTYPGTVDSDGVDLSFPTGEYLLNLSRFRDRVLMHDLLLKSSLKRGYVLEELALLPEKKGKKPSTRGIPVKLKRRANPAGVMGHVYGVWTANYKRGRHPYTNIGGQEWMELVDSIMLVEEASGKPFIIPDKGKYRLKFRYCPRCPTPIEVLNSTGMQRLINLLDGHRKELSEILRLCQSLTLETFQIDEIIQALELEKHKPQLLDLFNNLMICVGDTSNTDSLIRKYFHSEWHIKEIQLNLRSLYFICSNSFTGHYKLDTSHHLDRWVAIKLAQINAEERFYFRLNVPQWNIEKQKHGYTSQKGNKSNFRNEVFRNISFSGGFDDSFFSKGLLDKMPGTLEFDFVSTMRPAKDVRPIADYDLNALLMTRKLRSYVEGISIAMGINITYGKHRSVVKDESPSSKLPGHTHESKSENDDDNKPKEKDIHINSILLNSRTRYQKPVIENQIPATEPSEIKTDKSISEVIHHANVMRHIGLNFIKSFRRLRSQEGLWLSENKHSSFNFMKSDIRKVGGHLLNGFSSTEMENIHNEMMSGMALYYVGDEINRFVSRLIIRIHSNDIPNISPSSVLKNPIVSTKRSNVYSINEVSSIVNTFSRKSMDENDDESCKNCEGNDNEMKSIQDDDIDSDNSVSSDDSKESNEKKKGSLMIATQLQDLRKNLRRSHSKNNGNVPEKYRELGNIGGKARRLLPVEPYFGSIMEICCVYKRDQLQSIQDIVKVAQIELSPQTKTSSMNVSKAAQVVQYKHTGSYAYSTFRSRQPLQDQLICIELQEDNSASVKYKVVPTHKRFDICDDIFIAGDTIHYKVRVQQWHPVSKLLLLAKDIVCKLFAGFGVSNENIRVSHLSTIDGEVDDFVDSYVHKSIVTHVMEHYVDVAISTVPYLKKSTVKTSLVQTRSPSASNFADISHMYFLDSFRPNMIITSLKDTMDIRNPLESLSTGDKRNRFQHEKDILWGCIWRWKDIRTSDRDVMVEHSSNKKIEYLGRKYVKH